MRNPNGMGSIYKLSGKRRKPYVAVITTGYNLKGQQIRKSLGSFETRAKALECLMEYYKNPYRLETDKITFKEVYNLWSKEHYKNLKEVTKKNNEVTYNKYLSKFNDYVLKDIKLIHIQEFFNEIGNSGIATGTIKRIKSIMNMIFIYGVKTEVIEKNIIEFVELKRHQPKLKRRVFTEEEINILWDNLDVPFVDTVLIMIYTGLRVGELLNLKIEDIDLESNPKVISVKESKTMAGVRIVPIVEGKILSLITKRISKDSFYLITANNKKLNYDNYYYKFNELMDRLGIKDHTIHDCRHTTATMLSNAGANSTAIKNILGHTNYNLTEKVYTHKDKSELKKAMELIQ